jgi:tetratricopeptide (TPR) repeat protein
MPFFLNLFNGSAMTFYRRCPYTNVATRFACFLPLLALLILILAASPLAGAATPTLAEMDALMQSPGLDLAQAQQALAGYQGLLASSQGPRAPLLMRLAQVCFILGELAPQDQRRGFYQKGLAYAEQLLTEKPAGVAGHYWKALNLAGLAGTGGMLEGRRLLPRLLEELQRSLALDPTYDHAGAHRVLGRIYYQAPGWPLSVGNLNKSLEHLSAAVRLAPETSTNHLYLAETLIRLNQPARARQELQLVLSASQHAIHPQGLADDRREARRLLAEMAGK